MDFELPQDFKELLESLNRHKVKYLLIGGYAVGFHGYGRSTNDLDVVVSDDLENAQRIVNALTDFGFAPNDLSPELFTRKNSLVVMGVEPVAVDILNYLTGSDFDRAYERREIVKCEDIEISLINYKDLIANKKAAGRLKDLADVEKLQKIKG